MAASAAKAGSASSYDVCFNCGTHLSGDDVAIYRRLIDREAKEYLCAGCLAQRLHCPRELIDKKIAYFKSIGCLLFS